MQSPVVKLAIAELIKNLGNKSFNDKEYDQAIDYYLNAVCLFRYYCPVKKAIVEELSTTFESSALLQEVRLFINVVFLNITACYLAMKRFQKALLSIEESLKIDDLNDKAWFRKAKALEGTNEVNNLQNSIDCLELAIKHSKNQQDEFYFRKLLQELNDKYVNLRKAQQKSLGLPDASPEGTKAELKAPRKVNNFTELTSDLVVGGVTAPLSSKISK